MNERIQLLNQRDFRADAEYVLYWSQMNRRVTSNHALQFAAELANERDLPLLVYEAITCSYPFANDRFHTFLLQGVPDSARELKALHIGFAFYLRRRHKDSNAMLYRMAEKAAAVITDDYPTFVARTHNASVPAKLDVPYYVVDASCIVPMRCMEKREYAAYTIRPKIKKLLPKYLEPVPSIKMKHPFRGTIPDFHTIVIERNIPELVATCEIDHTVPPSTTFTGGSAAGQRHLRHFLEDNLRKYANGRNEPSKHVTSDLSPYLHFGHVSALDIALQAKEYAKAHDLIVDEFLEELIVRRELAFNFAHFAERPDSLSNLPEWARGSLRKHAADTRDPLYSRDQFEKAATYDALWNATQKEMLLRGKIHGYYRMYWGKKIIEWSKTCQDALETMIHIHDKYAIDGRDPNTFTNILWCFGLHDRPWGERPVFGMVRFMSLDGMKRKTDVDAYIQEIAELERTGADPFRVK